MQGRVAATTKLVRNYRSNKLLLDLPSRMFYNDSLLAAADPATGIQLLSIFGLLWCSLHLKIYKANSHSNLYIKLYLDDVQFNLLLGISSIQRNKQTPIFPLTMIPLKLNLTLLALLIPALHQISLVSPIQLPVCCFMASGVNKCEKPMCLVTSTPWKLPWLWN